MKRFSFVFVLLAGLLVAFPSTAEAGVYHHALKPAFVHVVKPVGSKLARVGKKIEHGFGRLLADLGKGIGEIAR